MIFDFENKKKMPKGKLIIAPKNLFLHSHMFDPQTIYGKKRTKPKFTKPKVNYTNLPGSKTYIG